MRIRFLFFCVRDRSGKPTAHNKIKFSNNFCEDLEQIARPYEGRARPIDYLK